MISARLLPEIASAPAPVLVFEGTLARVTGVRYLYAAWCYRCRQRSIGYSDGGTIRFGLWVRSDGEGRWLYADEPGEAIVAPAHCRPCGQQHAFPLGWDSGPYGPSSVYTANDLVRTGIDALRATPELSRAIAIADEYSRAGRRPTPRKRIGDSVDRIPTI